MRQTNPPSDNKPRYIIYGLPKSGTNYLNSLLCHDNNCLNVHRVGDRLWKHNTISRPDEPCVVVFVYRPLIGWLNSISKVKGSTSRWFRQNRGVVFANPASAAPYYIQYVSEQARRADVVISLKSLLENHSEEASRLSGRGLIVAEPHDRRVNSAGKITEERIEKKPESVSGYTSDQIQYLLFLLESGYGDMVSQITT